MTTVGAGFLPVPTDPRFRNAYPGPASFRVSSSEGIPNAPFTPSTRLWCIRSGVRWRSRSFTHLSHDGSLLAQTQAQVTPGEPQSAALTPQAQSGAQLPFRGSLQQTETGELQSPTLLVITGSAEGTATHLGRYTMTFRAEIDLTTRIGVGHATWVAANGDSLFTTGSGEATPTADPGISQSKERKRLRAGPAGSRESPVASLASGC